MGDTSSEDSSEDEHRILFGGEVGEGGMYDYEQDEESAKTRPKRLQVSKFDPTGKDFSDNLPNSPFTSENPSAKNSAAPTVLSPSPTSSIWYPARSRQEWRREEAIKSDFRWLYKQLMLKITSPSASPTNKKEIESEQSFAAHVDAVVEDEINHSSEEDTAFEERNRKDIYAVQQLLSKPSALLDSMKSRIARPLRLTPTGRAVVVDKLKPHQRSFDHSGQASSLATPKGAWGDVDYESQNPQAKLMSGSSSPAAITTFSLTRVLLHQLAQLSRCGAIPVYQKTLLKLLVSEQRPELFEAARLFLLRIVDLQQLQDYLIGVAWNISNRR